jgi:hypothetical protein
MPSAAANTCWPALPARSMPRCPLHHRCAGGANRFTTVAGCSGQLVRGGAIAAGGGGDDGGGSAPETPHGANTVSATTITTAKVCAIHVMRRSFRAPSPGDHIDTVRLWTTPPMWRNYNGHCPECAGGSSVAAAGLGRTFAVVHDVGSTPTGAGTWEQPRVRCQRVDKSEGFVEGDETVSNQQQNYPDSTGSHWEGGSGPVSRRAADRPAFMERTEPMSRQPRVADGPADDGKRPLTHGRLDSTPGGVIPMQRRIDAAAQWNNDRDRGTQAVPPTEQPYGGDPELAAASGFEGVAQQPPVRQPVQSPPDHPVSSQWPAKPATPPAGVPSAPESPGGFDEPTQLHHSVQQQTGFCEPQRFVEPPATPASPRRGPAQVGEGVYRRSRPALGIALAAVTLAMSAVMAILLVAAFVDGRPFNASAIVSATFALAGLPLTAWGLYPLLGMGPHTGPQESHVLLRPPYAVVLTGIALLIAAGLAA